MLAFFFCFFVLFRNTTPVVLVFYRHLHHTFLIPFALFYNEMVTVGKYRDRKSGTIANLQEYETADGILILNMRLVVCCRRVFLFLFYFFFQYIFQTGFI